MLLSGHDSDRLAAAQADIERETGNRPETFLCDVNQAEDIQTLVDHTVEMLGDIYALVNMGPGPKPGPFDSFDDAAFFVWELGRMILLGSRAIS